MPILLIEDNPADVYLVRAALDHHKISHQLNVIRNGATAMKYVESAGTTGDPCPQLIVLDLNLPKIGGLQVLDRIRTNPALAQTPVVILSSSGTAKERSEARMLGIAEYILKPADLDEFMDIGRILKGVLDRGDNA